MTGAPDAALRILHEHGRVHLPGAPSVPLRRALRRSRIATWCVFCVAGVGPVLFVVGLLLYDVGIWAALIPLGAAFAALGTLTGVIYLLVGLSWRSRIRSEHLPVIIEPAGLSMRGVGPIPWADLAPPTWRTILVKNDFGGHCPVMPLTEQGFRHVNAQPAAWKTLVGPRPYLRWTIPVALVPGIEGFTTAEAMDLLGAAHARFAPDRRHGDCST